MLLAEAYDHGSSLTHMSNPSMLQPEQQKPKEKRPTAVEKNDRLINKNENTNTNLLS